MLWWSSPRTRWWRKRWKEETGQESGKNMLISKFYLWAVRTWNLPNFVSIFLSPLPIQHIFEKYCFIKILKIFNKIKNEPITTYPLSDPSLQWLLTNKWFNSSAISYHQGKCNQTEQQFNLIFTLFSPAQLIKIF